LLPCASRGALAAPNGSASTGIDRSKALAGTILVVEDEEFLRLAVAKGLRQRGFSVIEVGDGSEAIDRIRGHKSDIHVILLDLTLPGKSSREVVEEARRLRPGVRIVLTSAYGKETADASFRGLQVDHFIRKPFHLNELVASMQQALETSRPPTDPDR
jgi:DNA-binding response OmpR family regulator